MIVLRAYKTELDLNNKQRQTCAKHAGTARFSYNWGLARKIEAYQAGQKTPTAIDLHRMLNELKRTDFPWMYEVSKCAPQEALRNLDKAFLNFFRRVKEKKEGKFIGKVGFPKFKSKKRGLGSFRLTGSIRINASRIKLPRLGWLRLKESGYLPVEGVVSTHRTLDGVKILNATVSELAGHWFVSVQVSCWFDKNFRNCLSNQQKELNKRLRLKKQPQPQLALTWESRLWLFAQIYESLKIPNRFVIAWGNSGENSENYQEERKVVKIGRSRGEK